MTPKKYALSFYDEEFKSKPNKKAIIRISENLFANELTKEEMMYNIAHCGCTFAPAVFKNNKRKKDNFLKQQLFALDFDDGITAAEVQERADRYRLPALFAYKTFSWTPEKEKFRVVFAFDRMVYDRHTAECIIGMLMFIFPESDKACKDVSRMFLGSNKGEIEGFGGSQELTIETLEMAVYQYAFDRSDEDHYKRKLNKLYDRLGIAVEKNQKIYHIDDKGNIVINKAEKRVFKKTDAKGNKAANDNSRRRASEVDFDILEKRCPMFHEFCTGKVYFYYPEMLLMASNFINIQNGKKSFMDIINSKVNDECTAYRERDWWVIMIYMYDRGYNPMRCDGNCPYASKCPHCKNMILTASPGKTNIVPLKKQKYVSIEEAEQSLRENINKAINSPGINIIKAQTGLGKTHTYLSYIAKSEDKFLVVVPTHKLADEICSKAQAMGIKDMIKVPEMKGLSDKLTAEIEHIYGVGAGIIGLQKLRNMLDNMNRSDPDYEKLKEYFAQYDEAIEHKGNLVITHERFMNLNENSDMLKNRKIIVDEDILRTMYATQCVSINDVKLALQKGIFEFDEEQMIKKFINAYYNHNKDTNEKKHVFMYGSGFKEKYIDESMIDALEDISGNVIDLVSARVLRNNGKNILYIKSRKFPCDDITIMSATIDPVLYEKLLDKKVNFYECKEAEYKGKVHVYTDSTYSRTAFQKAENKDELMNSLKEKAKNDEVITFQAIENEFNTKFHYGNVEGLNCMEGKDISVIGLPNIHEDVYKLYGMLMGTSPNEKMTSRRVEYHNHEFKMTTYQNELLRRIQMWFIYSQLEQAVGRARLLRYDCNVNVYARFPIEQGVYE